MHDQQAPLISIVTPCLNARSTIEKALDSVIAQGIANVEHIVVDGGSTDGTVEFLAQRPNLVWISEPDEGLSDAVNKGVALAAGDVIGWLNADDWYLPGAFDAVLSAASQHPDAAWFTGRCIIVDADGREIRRRVTRYKNFWLRHYSYVRYLTNNFISCPATFVRSQAYRTAGMYNLDHKYSMDYDMFLRLGRIGDPVVVDEDLAVFSMVEGTKSMTGFETQFREHYEIARARADGHRLAVAVSWGFSRLVVLIYHTMRTVRERRVQ